MEQTVLGFFEDNAAAQRAADELIKAGFNRSQIDIAMPEGTDEEVRDEQTEESGITRFFKSLFGEGESADRYANVSRGFAMVTVHTKSEQEAEEAADVMDDCGAVDIDEHEEEESGRPMRGNQPGAPRSGEERSDIANRNDMQDNAEDFRTNEKYAQRQRSRIVDRPVEDGARMHQARDEQNAIDSAASAPALELFKEGEIELTEHKEVPVVKKEARVVEEIELKKVVEDREETVRDSVRETKVDINRIDVQNQDYNKGLTESRPERNKNSTGVEGINKNEINSEKEDWEKRSSGDPLFGG